MSDLRQRVILIHKLRQLAGTKEFLNCRRDWLRIDQVLRHEAFAFSHREALFYCSLYPDKTHSELILGHFANRTNAAITQMIDIIHDPFTVSNADQRPHHVNDIVFVENR